MHYRRRYNLIDSIKRGLSLIERTYREFYTLVERAIARQGWISNTFRSISEKETVYKELAIVVLAN